MYDSLQRNPAVVHIQQMEKKTFDASQFIEVKHLFNQKHVINFHIKIPFPIEVIVDPQLLSRSLLGFENLLMW